MPITPKQIIQISNLARIKIEKDQVHRLTEKIGEIISFVDKLKTIDTNEIKPLLNPLDAIQKLRSDKITEIDESENFLGIAPSVSKNLFVVPKVLDKIKPENNNGNSFAVNCATKCRIATKRLFI